MEFKLVVDENELLDDITKRLHDKISTSVSDTINSWPMKKQIEEMVEVAMLGIADELIKSKVDTKTLGKVVDKSIESIINKKVRKQMK